jgi:hypothetical protein
MNEQNLETIETTTQKTWWVLGLKVLKVNESRRNLVALPLNGGFIVR